MTDRHTLLTLLFALVSAAPGCMLLRPKDPNAASQPSQSTDAPMVSERQGPISDANIVAMVMASNNTDISYARLVPARARALVPGARRARRLEARPVPAIIVTSTTPTPSSRAPEGGVAIQFLDCFAPAGRSQ